MKKLSNILQDVRDMGQLMFVGIALTVMGAVILYQAVLAAADIVGVCSVTFGIIIYASARTEYKECQATIARMEELIKQGTPYDKALEKAHIERNIDYDHEDINDVT